MGWYAVEKGLGLCVQCALERAGAVKSVSTCGVGGHPPIPSSHTTSSWGTCVLRHYDYIAINAGRTAGRDRVSDTPWLVRRMKTHNGGELRHPTLYGKVFASSATVAIKKFLETIRSGDNKDHFDAVPFTKSR
jgi:hypothetical protein